MSAIKISLVITILNERNSIESLLTALQAQSVLPHETIIVDGGSHDGTYEWLEKNLSRFRTLGLKILTAKGNRSVGRNTGISLAKNDWIAITDAGCIPHANWLEKLKAKVVSHQLKDRWVEGLVVAGYYDAKPQTPFEEAVVPYVLVMPDRVNPQTFLPATRSVLFHKRIWNELNGFDEQLSDNEDYDFAKRLEKLARERNLSGYELPLEIVFAKAAKVTWIPRTNLKSFGWMIYRFARGDAKAGIWRPKVGLVFVRYILLLLISLGLIAMGSWITLLVVWLLGICFYATWSIQKNIEYVPHGWYWLPVLQVVADFEVMRGSLRGVIH